MGVRHAGVRWDIDVDFFDWEEKVRLYRDGRQARVQHGTSSFALGDGTRIEVAWSTYGLRRAHLVMTDGSRRQLAPVRGTAERWRAELDRDRPVLSRWLGVASWMMLVIALVLQVPQVLSTVAEVTGWYEFASPLALPAWINTPLTIAAGLAALERALRLRHHWLLD